jgi:peptidoglycan/xylan/chitin deacetylase (PgdA/CDA1 family)
VTLTPPRIESRTDIQWRAAAERARRRLIAGIAVVGAILCPGLSDAEKVALTFDDLPLNGILAQGTTEADVAGAAIAILKRHHVPRVYGFVNGRRMERGPAAAAALKAWVAAGYGVGNHTYHHSDLSQVTAAEFIADIRENEPILELLDSSGSWHWFRYPYLREGNDLEKRNAVRVELLSRSYRVAQVTLDYEDYLWNSAYARCVARGDREAVAWLRSTYLDTAAAYIDADRVMARMVFGRPIDHVLLLHLGAFTGEILPSLLKLLRDKGFTMATLEAVEHDDAYSGDPNLPSTQGGTLLEQWMEARGFANPPVPPKPYNELERVCGGSP